MKLGKKPARPDAARFKFDAFFDKRNLPVPPPVFGHWRKVQKWGMLGNEDYGDCVWAGAAHETMMWTMTTGHYTAFLDDNVLSDYSAVTGFHKNDPKSDEGTDMVEAASYRRKTGVIDWQLKRHKIDSYVALDRGSISDLMVATFLFGATGIGFMFPEYAMDQFNEQKPWDVIPGQPEPTSGHYVPVVGRNAAGNILVVSWGRLHAMTPAFYTKYNDESLAYVSLEPLTLKYISPEGYDLDALRASLKSLPDGQ